MKCRIAFSVLLFLAVLSPLATAAPNIIVGDDTIDVGGTASIPVTFQGDGITVAFQFQIDYDETQFTASADCDFQTGSPIPPLGVVCNPAFDIGGGDLVIQYVSSIVVSGMGPGDFDLGNVSFQHIGSSADTFPLVVQNYLGGAIDETEIPSTGDTDGQIVVERIRGNKPVKALICHIGNEVGPNDETYLDDPYCAPNELNDYFCPNAGKIDLIYIPEKAAEKHLANPDHSWDGTPDYDPIAEGATGVGAEDSDGNGIDDGCEIPEPCLCWDKDELLSVTAVNQRPGLSCSSYILEIEQIAVQNQPGSTPGVEGGFSAVYDEGLGLYACVTRDFPQALFTTPEEALICYTQIVDRCAEIGDPIFPD